MKKVVNFFKPDRTTLYALIGLICLYLITLIVLMNGNSSSSNLVSWIFAGINILWMLLSLGLITFSLLFCPVWGDSNPDTNSCGGFLPQGLSVVLGYLCQLVVLYIFALLIGKAINKLKRRRVESKNN